MSAPTRAFFGAAVALLLAAAALHAALLLGAGGVWAALIHLALFGWVTGMICAVNYHTMPVFSGRDFPRPGLIYAHLISLCAGVALAAAGLLLALRPLELLGLALELLAALLFCLNVGLLLTRGPRRPHRPPTPPIPGQRELDRIGTRATAAAGLCLPAALALLLAARGLSPRGEWVLAAEHLAAVGWTLLMIVGVAYHVLPRFSGAATRGPRLAALQLGLHLAAVTSMAPALALGWGRLFALGGVALAVALGLFAWVIWPTLRPLAAGPAIQVSVKGAPR